MKLFFEISKEKTAEDAIENVVAELPAIIRFLPAGKWEMDLRRPVRTSRQNKSCHLFLGWLAASLNESGNFLTMKYFKKEFKVFWTAELAKERIWRPIQRALTKKESSAKLTTAEVVMVADTIRDNLSAELGIHLDFPDEIGRQLDQENNEA